MRKAVVIPGHVIAALLIAQISMPFRNIPLGTANGASESSLASIKQIQHGCRMLGPYATMRRANEIAGQAQASGFSAVAFHNGDGYYVRVC